MTELDDVIGGEGPERPADEPEAEGVGEDTAEPESPASDEQATGGEDSDEADEAVEG